jgi:hypothetical protein
MATAKLKLPPQVVRLVLLTLGIVGSYLVARYFLTPASFGQYGFYRGQALDEMASHPITYAGRAACEDCHYDECQKVLQFEHKTLSCEACHGAAQAHVENPDIKPAVLTYSHCVRCHEANPSRPAWHKQIDSRDHYTGEPCVSCHVPHAPTEVPEEPPAP